MNAAITPISGLKFPLIPLTSFKHDESIDQAALCQKFKEQLEQAEITPCDYKRLLWAYSTCQQMIENGNKIIAVNGIDVGNDHFLATVWLFTQKQSALTLQSADENITENQIIRFDFTKEWNKIITS